MSTMRPVSWAYTEEFPTEPETVQAARRRGEELGAPPVRPAVGAALAVLAAAVSARSVVEVGTGAGTSGLWLLSGMPSDGVLTTIDVDLEHQRAAKHAYTAAGIAPQRTRAISGSALDVMPRLADGAYDLVFVDGEKAEYPDYAEQALRLLRPGGMLLMDNMLWNDRVADPTVRDATTVLLRDLGKRLRDDDRLRVSLLPVGDGLLVAIKVA